MVPRMWGNRRWWACLALVALSAGSMGCSDGDERPEALIDQLGQEPAEPSEPTLEDALLVSTALPSGYRLINRGSAAVVPAQDPFCEGHHPGAAVPAHESHRAVFGRQPDGPWVTQLVGDWGAPERGAELMIAVRAAVEACGTLTGPIDGSPQRFNAAPTPVEAPAAHEMYAVRLEGEDDRDGRLSGVLVYARTGGIVVQVGHIGRQGIDPAETQTIIQTAVDHAAAFA